MTNNTTTSGSNQSGKAIGKVYSCKHGTYLGSYPSSMSRDSDVGLPV